MIEIKSKISNGIWEINDDDVELNSQDIEFVEQFNPSIYHNDLNCKLWAFDTKMPSGKWITDIFFNNELTIAKANIISI